MADEIGGQAGGQSGLSPGGPIQFGAPKSVNSATPADAKDYDPVKADGVTRTYIAWALLGITALIIVLTYGTAFFALSPRAPIETNLKTVLAVTNVVFGPIIALLGSVIGFYFGSRAASAAGGRAA